MFKFVRDHRRKKLLERPFPTRWEEILAERLPFFGELDGPERERFEAHLKVFLWEKQWIPAGGLEEVTEEMKVVIAACAARLVRNLPLDAYDRLTEVIVYPASFTGDRFEHAEILGLAHPWGTVVLAWDAVRKGIATPNDGRDTAIHEFAHALDVADGLYDGTPLLETAADYRDWVRVLGEHFTRLVDRPHGQILDEYGAKNEAEFFAVATEAFFEKPRTLRRKAPELYEQLRRFYELDPA
jgi:Mlc titration factor MtfA (ptsG expression regulator)